MRKKLNNYVGAAVNDELFFKLWAVSVYRNESLAETMRFMLFAGGRRLYDAIPKDKLAAIEMEVAEIRAKIGKKK